MKHYSFLVVRDFHESQLQCNNIFHTAILQENSSGYKKRSIATRPQSSPSHSDRGTVHQPPGKHTRILTWGEKGATVCLHVVRTPVTSLITLKWHSVLRPSARASALPCNLIGRLLFHLTAAPPRFIATVPPLGA